MTGVDAQKYNKTQWQAGQTRAIHLFTQVFIHRWALEHFCTCFMSWQITGSQSMKIKLEVIPLLSDSDSMSNGRLLNHYNPDSLWTHQLSVVVTSDVNSDPFTRKSSWTSGHRKLLHCRSLPTTALRYYTVVVLQYDLLHLSLRKSSVFCSSSSIVHIL